MTEIGRPSRTMSTPAAPRAVIGRVTAQGCAAARAEPGLGGDPGRSLHEAGALRGEGAEFGVGGEQGEQRRQVAGPGGGEEGIDHGTITASSRVRLPGHDAHAAASAAREHLHRVGRATQHVGDLAEGQIEDVVEHERDAFGRGQAVHHDVQRQPDRLGEQGLVLGRRSGRPAAAEQLVQIDLDRHLPARAAGPQHVQTDAARHRRQPRAEILDAVAARSAQAQPRLLERVVRVVAGTEHPQRDRAQVRAMALELPRPDQCCRSSCS